VETYTSRPKRRAARGSIVDSPIFAPYRAFVISTSSNPLLRQFRRGLVGLLACCACAGQSGCVQRRITIRSNPPGALVYVDDYPIGTTPVSTSFVYYGTRKVRLVLSGYETLTVLQPIPDRKSVV
jgi:hypothetical protein